jgi:hypothetical protein
VQALASRKQEYYHSIHYRDGARGHSPTRHPRDELWLDFICDTGDGWNSTYAVAYARRSALRVQDGKRRPAARRRRRGVSRAEPRSISGGWWPPARRPSATTNPPSAARLRRAGQPDRPTASQRSRSSSARTSAARLAGWWYPAPQLLRRNCHRWWLVASDGQLQSVSTRRWSTSRIAERHMRRATR